MILKLRVLAMSLTLAALAISCGLLDGTEIAPDNYPRDCDQDAECAVIVAGDICACGYPAAIHRDGLGDYQRDSREAFHRCAGQPSCLPTGDEVVAQCRAGRCEARVMMASDDTP